MNYEEFLKQLEQLLLDVSVDERREALEYYRNYFEDAGKEKEQEVLQELGSPKDAADSLKNDLKRTQEVKNEYVVSEKRTNNAGKTVLIILLLIFTSPLWISFVISIIAIVFSLIVSVAAVALTGIVTIVFGITRLVSQTAFGVLTLGVGLLLLAAGMSIMALIIKAGMIILPKGINAVVNKIRKPIHKKEEY